MNFKKLFQAIREEYQKDEILLPEIVDLDQNIQSMHEQMQAIQAAITNALSPQELNSLPEALRNNKFIDGFMFRGETKRVTKNINAAVDQINAVAQYTQGLNSVLQQRTELYDKLQRTKVLPLITQLNLQIELAERQARLKELKQPPVDIESQRKARITFEPYRQRLLAIGYDVRNVEMLISQGALPEEIKEVCEGILANVPEKPSKKKQQPSIQEIYAAFAEGEIAKMRMLKKIEQEIDDPKEAQEVIQNIKDQWQRFEMDRQE